jgi:hypothetical protein
MSAEPIPQALGGKEWTLLCPGDRAPGRPASVTSPNGEANAPESERYII